MKKIVMIYEQFEEDCKLAERLIYQIVHEYRQFDAIHIQRLEERYDKTKVEHYKDRYEYVPAFFVNDELVWDNTIDYDTIFEVLTKGYESDNNV